MKQTVFLNLITTGLSMVDDKIIEISMVKVDADLNPVETYSQRFNSDGRELSDYTKKLTGWTAEDLIDEPLFETHAKDIADFIGDNIIGNYNTGFHLIFLVTKLTSAGVMFEYNEANIVDPLLIHRAYATGAFENVYKLYTGETFEYTSNADKVVATITLYKAQVDKGITGIQLVDRGVEKLDRDGCFVKVKKDDGYDIIYGLGRYKGKSVTSVDPSYLNWIIYKSEFPSDTVQIACKLYAHINNLNQ